MKKSGIGRILCLILILSVLLPAAACAEDNLPVVILDVLHNTSSGGVNLRSSVEDFHALGFAYGDSVDVAFSNGYLLSDIPYYSGYYCPVGEPELIGSPSSSRIKVTIKFGDDLWEVAALEDGMTATVKMNTPGRYLDIQEAWDIHYEDDRELFSSDEEFANFRCIRVGNLKDNTLYRSASPCDNKHNRAPYTDLLMSEAGIQFVLDLADTEQSVQEFMNSEDFNSPWFENLYWDGKVVTLGLKMNYASEMFGTALTSGLAVMSECEGPYLIHCAEGKDRTGFACMLLEALADASYAEIEQDFMITYFNYYDISKEDTPDKYNVIVENMFHPMLRTMIGDDAVDFTSAPLSGYAEQFLLDAGMSAESVENLKDRILTDIPAEKAA